MKKKFIIIFLSVFTAYLFAQVFSQGINDNGMHSFETTIDFLALNNINDEIVIQNNSSFDLDEITCQIKINEKTHNLKSILHLLIGEDENFDGYKDDDMEDELRFYFGNDGKISTINKNKILFVFHFGKHNNKVILNRVYKTGKDICFEIIDKS